MAEQAEANKCRHIIIYLNEYNNYRPTSTDDDENDSDTDESTVRNRKRSARSKVQYY